MIVVVGVVVVVVSVEGIIVLAFVEVHVAAILVVDVLGYDGIIITTSRNLWQYKEEEEGKKQILRFFNGHESEKTDIWVISKF